MDVLCFCLALIIGVYFYWRYPVAYIGFVWWLWMFTPEIRRLIDYATGYHAVSLVIVAPLAVTGLSCLSLHEIEQDLLIYDMPPFFLCLAGLIYSFLIGAITASPMAALYTLCNWIIPIFFGLHLLSVWRAYPEYREMTQRAFLIGVLVMGSYGVVQFLLAPPWDCYWMVHSRMTSIGTPAPFQIRVFSTLNSPGPFADVMASGLLLLFISTGSCRLVAAGTGYLAFLLSLVRSAWGAWAVGLVILIVSLNSSRRGWLIQTLVVTGILIISLINVSPFSEIVSARLSSFSNLQSDISFNARSSLYNGFLYTAFLNPVGAGLGHTGDATHLGNKNGDTSDFVVLDSGILDIAYSLGWLGAIPYLGGIVLLLARASHDNWNSRTRDLFPRGAYSILVCTLSLLLFENSLTGVTGMVFWGFLGMNLAAHRYQQGSINSPQKLKLASV